MMPVQLLAKRVQALGFHVTGVTAPTPSEDGQVDITADVHIQVGRTYLIVNRWVDNGEAIEQWPARTDVLTLAADLRAALLETVA